MNNIMLFKPFFRKEEVLDEIGQCLDIGWTGIGYKTEEFEQLLCDYSKLNHCHFLNSIDNKIVSLPLHLNLSDEDVSYITNSANKFTF